MTTTVIRPWSPGEPIPSDLIRLGPTPRDTLAAVEERARFLVRQIAGDYATLRRWAHDPEGWGELTRRVLVRHRAELRGVLRARRALRYRIEREEDRLDAAVNGNG